MPILKKIFTLTFLLFVVGCGIYQSEGRKQFESQVQPQQFGIGFNLSSENCKNTPTLKAWMQLEQMPTESELEFSRGKLEVWKTNSEINDSLEIQTVLPKASTTFVCKHQFNNQQEWSEFKEQFIQEALRAYDDTPSF